MIAGLIAKIFGTANARQLSRIQPIVAQINAFEPAIQALSDEQLTHKTVEFRAQLATGKTLDDILPEAFAVVRETSRRKLGQRHYDVQLVGGIVLHQGKISEMKTGEGKTLTATLALYLNALSGKGAHLVTVNDYLARRDAAWMSPIFNHLGLTVGIIQNNMHDAERQKAYACDIVYATNNELGFDYLRDNMKFRLEDYVQRDLNYAIVDEVDSILIDEARTPLIISGSSDEGSILYAQANAIALKLVDKIDYEIDEKEKSVQLTEAGIDKVEAAYGIKNLYAIENIKLLHHINQALRAHTLFKRDVDYVVKDDEVLIVDEFTGRMLAGRRYSDGLHQALEAKERVTVERESQTLAAITLQNYFRLYKKLAGMTGTAATEAEEFHRIYKLDVVSIPTNQAMIRDDKPDYIFLSKNAKYKAIVKDIQERYAKGQPVLIGTIAIETSEFLSNILKMHGIPHEVLNAKQHAREADIVAHAGEKGHVTIATNMAGRGTDIKLTADSIAAGGLYILGTERHESRRIDNQLRGRSGRQGDPGESRFYISLEDDLIRIFAGEGIKKNMQRFGMTEEETIESPMISRNIENSQEKVEKRNFEVRKHLLEYDDVLNQQRIVMYQYRRIILEGNEGSFDLIRDLIDDAVGDIVSHHAQERALTGEIRADICKAVAQMTGIGLEELNKQAFSENNSEVLRSDIINYLLKRYDLIRNAHSHNNSDNENPGAVIREAQKWIMLESLDQAWKQHMLNLDHLKEGIGLRGWGQKNPLIEYKREAFAMFEDMMRAVRFEIIHHIFHINFEKFDTQALAKKREDELDQLQLAGTASPEETQAQAVASDKVNRNEACPCGSDKKYKKCHGK
ncbi:MAG: preprotein translocase subunit SecA [Candidatus Babeliaceae bacterium]|jgi:preprotein translocase subunit SecA